MSFFVNWLYNLHLEFTIVIFCFTILIFSCDNLLVKSNPHTLPTIVNYTMIALIQCSLCSNRDNDINKIAHLCNENKTPTQTKTMKNSKPIWFIACLINMQIRLFITKHDFVGLLPEGQPMATKIPVATPGVHYVLCLRTTCVHDPS